MTLLQRYLGSKELKKIIVERSFKFEIPLRYVCKEVGLEYKHFMDAYINSLENKDFVTTEDQFEKLLELLGIRVRVQFLVQGPENYDAAKIKEDLEIKYGNVTKEKRTVKPLE